MNSAFVAKKVRMRQKPDTTMTAMTLALLRGHPPSLISRFDGHKYS